MINEPCGCRRDGAAPHVCGVMVVQAGVPTQPAALKPAPLMVVPVQS